MLKSLVLKRLHVSPYTCKLYYSILARNIVIFNRQFVKFRQRIVSVYTQYRTPPPPTPGFLVGVPRTVLFYPFLPENHQKLLIYPLIPEDQFLQNAPKRS